jgi:ribosomal protein S18 acetylase RimI-like enzyme
MTDRRLRELEETVVDAWPASDSARLDGWLLRASGGPTHRGNSVATAGASSALTLDRRIAESEAWYRERAQPPMFQVGPCASPAGLDRELAERGYVKQGEALLAAAPPSQVVARTPSCFTVSVETSASSAWRKLAAQSSRFAATQTVLFGFLSRLGERCRFVTAYTEQGEPAATCLGISSGERVGVYAMLSLPELRRRGAARSMLKALAESALAEGAHELYLLVEENNAPARALYAASGFRDIYRYHYRVPAPKL